MTAEARAQVYKVGIEFRGTLFGALPFYQKIDFQSSKTDLRYSSKLLEIDDPVLLNIAFRGTRLGDAINNLSSQLPQQVPWTERALILEFGTKLQLTQAFSSSLAITHYNINLVDYEYGENETRYNNNTALNLALWYEPSDHLVAYLRGEISSHNRLGMDPLSYNRKTSKFFAQPQGQISLGMMFKF